MFCYIICKKLYTVFNCRTRLFENLRMLPHAPGVQVQAIPEDGAIVEDLEAEDRINPDERLSQHDLDKRIQRDNEYSDSEEEGEGGRRDNRLYKVIIIHDNSTKRVILCMHKKKYLYTYFFHIKGI